MRNITIGIVADRFIDSYEYTLQTIYSQTMKEYKLLISLDKYYGINIAELVDLL